MRHTAILASASILLLALIAACDGSDATTTPTPSPTADPEAAYVDQTLALVARRVEQLRGLDAGDGPTITLLTDEDLAALIDELLAEADSIDAITHDQALYTLLGLIDADTDLLAVTREVSIAGIAGLYRPQLNHLYIRMFGGFSALEESTASHEYQHYLQDRHFNLQTMLNGANRDTTLAVHALVEGEASYIQNQYVIAHFNAAQAFSMGFGGALAAVDAPAVLAVLARETRFVYLGGLFFVSDLLATGRSADQLFQNPPTTTEQLLHPAKYRVGEVAIDVTPLIADLLLPPAWTVQSTDVLGEFMLDAWLREVGAGSDAADAAAGWGGDAYHLLTSDGGTTALIALIEWDTPQDQREFVDVVTAALDDRYGGLACASCDFPVFIGPGGPTGIAEGASDGHAWTILVVAPSGDEVASLINAAR